MKRLNFENKTTDDDVKLVALLQEQIELPSNELVNQTMEMLTSSRANKKHSYTPLKFPVCMMGLILSTMVMPAWISIEFDIQSYGPTEFIVDPIVGYLGWAWLAISLLLVATTVSRINVKSALKLFNA